MAKTTWITADPVFLWDIDIVENQLQILRKAYVAVSDSVKWDLSHKEG